MKAFLLLFLISNFNLMAESPQIPVTIDSRIKTFVYSENEIFELKFSMGYQSTIEFAQDESIELISLGNPYPWKLTPIDRRLFIKPIQPGAHTNMTVITNKHVYLFDVKSDTVNPDDDIDTIHVVRFFYPTRHLDKTKFDINDYIAEKEAIMAERIRKADVLLKEAAEPKKRTRFTTALSQDDTTKSTNISYSFVGSYNDATPAEIFDDHKDTFIRFDTKNHITPKIYTIEENGETKIADTKRIGGLTVVPGVHAKFHIKQGINETYVYNDLLVTDVEN